MRYDEALTEVLNRAWAMSNAWRHQSHNAQELAMVRLEEMLKLERELRERVRPIITPTEPRP